MVETSKTEGKKRPKRNEKGQFLERGGPGRAPGQPNKLTGLKQQYLEGIEIAAKAGGLDGVAAWLAEVAKEDAVAYAKIMASLIPKEVKQDITQRTVDEFGKELAGMSDEDLRRLARAVETGESNETTR